MDDSWIEGSGQHRGWYESGRGRGWWGRVKDGDDWDDLIGNSSLQPGAGFDADFPRFFCDFVVQKVTRELPPWFLDPLLQLSDVREGYFEGSGPRGDHAQGPLRGRLLVLVVHLEHSGLDDAIALVVGDVVVDPEKLVGVDPAVGADDGAVLEAGLLPELAAVGLELEEAVGAVVGLDVVLGGRELGGGRGQGCGRRGD